MDSRWLGLIAACSFIIISSCFVAFRSFEVLPWGLLATSVTILTAPADEVPQLSKELAWAAADSGEIFVTWANEHFSDFAVNWALHLKDVGVHNILVGAMDAGAAKTLISHGIPVFAMYERDANSTGLTGGDFGWGSPSFTKMGRQKVDLAHTFLSYGLNLTLADSDAVFAADPRAFFASHPRADVLAHTDKLNSGLPAGDEGLEEASAIHAVANIGLLVFRARPQTLAFVAAWRRGLTEDPQAWDQTLFNQLLHAGPMAPEPPPSRLTHAWNDALLVGILPTASYSSGHVAYVSGLAAQKNLTQVMVHTTFQYGGTPGKRNRLREGMLWYDPPAYHAGPRFLSIDVRYPEVPPGIQTAGEEGMGAVQLAHLEGILQQMLQIRAGMAMAVALNRTFIMPKLLCLCDRYWGPLDRCRIPGAEAVPLPFTCPMDHVFELGNLDETMEGGEPRVPFREYSFLDNPRTPADVKDDVLVLELEGAAARSPADTPPPDVGRPTLSLPVNSTDVGLRAALEAQGAPHRIHVTDPLALWGGWEEPGADARLANRFLRSLGFWCCRRVPQGQDGGVGYADLLLNTQKVLQRIQQL